MVAFFLQFRMISVYVGRVLGPWHGPLTPHTTAWQLAQSYPTSSTCQTEGAAPPPSCKQASGAVCVFLFSDLPDCSFDQTADQPNTWH